MILLMGVAYAYELRRGEEVLSTGRLTTESELGPEDELALEGILSRVDELGWVTRRGAAHSAADSALTWWEIAPSPKLTRRGSRRRTGITCAARLRP
jgi:hypothetical protein